MADSPETRRREIGEPVINDNDVYLSGTEINPLDIIFFDGDGFISEAIRWGQWLDSGDYRFTHVGIVVNTVVLPNVEGMKEGVLYIWESTTSLGSNVDKVYDVERRKPIIGVQIRELKEVIYSYGGDSEYETSVYLGRLKNNPCKHNGNTMDYMSNIIRVKKILSEIHEDYGEKWYEYNPLTLPAAVLKSLRPIRDVVEVVMDTVGDVVEGAVDFVTGASSSSSSDDGSSGFFSFSSEHSDVAVFCSEFVAVIYQKIGILDEVFDPSNVVPTDFLGNDTDGMPNMVEELVKIK
jgi:hypothetical protein